MSHSTATAAQPQKYSHTLAAMAGQSRPGLVSAMGAVWRHPALMFLEVGWRWAVGVPLLAITAAEALRARQRIAIDVPALQRITAFEPAAAVHTIGGVLSALRPAIEPVAWWLVPMMLLAWSAAAGLGRTVVWRGLDPSLRPRRSAVLTLSALRALLLGGFFVAWCSLALTATRVAISGPAEHGGEPNLVLFCGILIGATLGLFVLWCVTSWVLEAAPLIAMRTGESVAVSVPRALRLQAGRSRLVEINLVMGIVRVALLVLAMVFSACPLPFESVESPTFLAIWWVLIGLLYLLAADYFKVVRAAVYLSVLSEPTKPKQQVAPNVEPAS